MSKDRHIIRAINQKIGLKERQYRLLNCVSLLIFRSFDFAALLIFRSFDFAAILIFRSFDFVALSFDVLLF